MHWLNGKYSAWFNRRHQRCGHLLQGRFKSVLVEGEHYLREVIRYTVLNPVRAGMVARPEEYRWSSYRSSAGIEPGPEWLDLASLRELFDPDPAAARQLYEEFIDARVDSQERLWDQVQSGMYFGSVIWARRMRKMVESRPRSTDHPKSHRAVGRPKMHEIVATVARVTSSTVAVIRTRGNHLRRLIAWIGWHEGLVTLRSIAAALRLRSEGYVSGMIGRCEREFTHDRSLLRDLDLALAILRA
jgi:hypothetical protein